MVSPKVLMIPVLLLSAELSPRPQIDAIIAGVLTNERRQASFMSRDRMTTYVFTCDATEEDPCGILRLYVRRPDVLSVITDYGAEGRADASRCFEVTIGSGSCDDFDPQQEYGDAIAYVYAFAFFTGPFPQE